MIDKLQELLVRLSNGTWEHGNGIQISNLDNPGWHFDLCLDQTPWEKASVPPIFEDKSENDWFHIKTEARGFENYLTGNCGPQNLGQMLAKMFELLDQLDRKLT